MAPAAYKDLCLDAVDPLRLATFHAGSVQELLDLGATIVDEQPRWTVMADPEGGEFCAFVREEPPPYRLYEVVLDAADHRALGRWWADLLGGRCID